MAELFVCMRVYMYVVIPTGRDFHSTIKFNISTGEEYCERFACGTEVAFDIKQIGSTPSSLFSETGKQQSAVYSE